MSAVLNSGWTFGKSEVSGGGGLVTAGHRLAAEAGLEMLVQGGNAVDAAVAAAWTIAVVEPWMNGLGGSGAMVIRHEGTCLAIDYGIRAPLAAMPDMYDLDYSAGPVGQFGWPSVKGLENEIGYRAVGVPGVVAGLCLAHRRFGRLPLSVTVEPAIRLAETGFDVDWYATLIMGLHQEHLLSFPETARTFLREGRLLPRPSVLLSTPDRIVQTDLATTLRLIARRGADAFYAGEVGAAIADDMAANGGLLTQADLVNYAPRSYPGGLVGRYRDHEVVGVPGGTAGALLQEMLNILAGYDIASLGPGSTTATHLLAEAAWRAYADHFKYAGDEAVPVAVSEELLSELYAAAVRKTINRDKATADLHDVGLVADGGRGGGARAGAGGPPAPSHTTHLCAVDREHNAVSLTQTLGHLFGSTVIARGTGVVLNDMMVVFDPRPGQANSIAGGKAQIAPYAPTILLRDGKLVAAVGAPGGRRIPTALAQVIVNLVDHRMGIQKALSEPRIHAESVAVEIDDRVGKDVIAGLAAIGHQLVVEEKTVCSFNFAQPNGIMVDEAGILHGGTDPFAPGSAVAIAGDG